MLIMAVSEAAFLGAFGEFVAPFPLRADGETELQRGALLCQAKQDELS